MVIGWHFTSEGLSHFKEPNWSSEGLLRQGKGPLAPLFQSYLPNAHGFEDALTGVSPPKVDEEKLTAKVKDFARMFEGYDKTTDSQKEVSERLVKWHLALDEAWHQYGDAFKKHYGLNADQEHAMETAIEGRSAQTLNWVAENYNDLVKHAWEKGRWAKEADRPGASEIPFLKKRVSENQSKISGESRSWVTTLNQVEKDLKQDLRGLLTADQAKKPAAPGEITRLQTVDRVMKYFLPTVGIMLIVGFLTPLAALAAAGFLFSVCAQQPFWLPDTVPTYLYIAEMFALLAVAANRAGRWAGLDFFVSKVCPMQCCKKTSCCNSSGCGCHGSSEKKP